MNILIIHEIDWIKKVSYEPHHLAELFSIKGHNIFIIDCKEPEIKHLIKGFHTSIISNYNRLYKNASITIIRPPSLLLKGFNRATHFLTCQKIIKKTVQENKIDIIWLYGVASNGIQSVKIAKEFNIPIIQRQLDVSHEFVKVPFLKQLTKKYEKFVTSNVSKVLCSAPQLINYAIEMGAKEKNVEYFPLGFDPHVFKPMVKDRQLADDLGISDIDKVILFVGTIYEFAGLENILQKFENIKDNIPEIKFLIIGGGPNFEKIKHLINKKNLKSYVILTNFKPQSEIPKFISLSDVCINPFEINKITDGIIPIKIFEYLACGKPVLSTPLKGTMDLLNEEDFGIIYSPYDMFVDNLSNLLTDTKKLNELSKKGLDYIIKNHDWNILSDSLLKKFENLIKINIIKKETQI
jgi:glycosyltransferase involved in cell wall biosynthesis